MRWFETKSMCDKIELVRHNDINHCVDRFCEGVSTFERHKHKIY